MSCSHHQDVQIVSTSGTCFIRLASVALSHCLSSVVSREHIAAQARTNPTCPLLSGFEQVFTNTNGAVCGPHSGYGLCTSA